MNQQTLSWRSKLSFGMGAFGKDLVYAIVSTYFMKYLTDVRLVDPMFVAVLFMAARIWDAFNDPFMGMVADNTRSRWGKFRPWILIGTILNAVVLVFLYLDVDLTAGQYAVYVGIMYILWGMTYTIMDIPYWSMVPALTDNENERSQISAIPRFFASMAWLVVGSGGLYIIKYLGSGDQIPGFSRFAIAVALIFIVTILLTVTQTRERVVATAGTGEKTTPRRMIEVLVKNDQVLVVLGIALSSIWLISFQQLCPVLFRVCLRGEGSAVCHLYRRGRYRPDGGAGCVPQPFQTDQQAGGVCGFFAAAGGRVRRAAGSWVSCAHQYPAGGNLQRCGQCGHRLYAGAGDGDPL